MSALPIESITLLASVWTACFLSIILTNWRLKNGDKNFKDIAIASALSLIGTSIISIIFIGKAGLVVALITLPLILIISCLVFKFRSLYFSIWLGLSLLTPGLYSSYVYIKARGFSQWIDSLWSKNFMAFELATHFASMTFSPLFIKILFIQFIGWGIVIFLIKTIKEKVGNA